ncbi:MAG: hypothetical protein MZV63_21680 [Marinilabiliales bacterium]|nr:hypothetical protein [Marinilabiliales bacterium]
MFNLPVSPISYQEETSQALDFVMKMLEKYKFLSTEWLLFGKGNMYSGAGNAVSLFDDSLDVPANDDNEYKRFP